MHWWLLHVIHVVSSCHTIHSWELKLRRSWVLWHPPVSNFAFLFVQSRSELLIGALAPWLLECLWVEHWDEHWRGRETTLVSLGRHSHGRRTCCSWGSLGSHVVWLSSACQHSLSLRSLHLKFTWKRVLLVHALPEFRVVIKLLHICLIWCQLGFCTTPDTNVLGGAWPSRD